MLPIVVKQVLVPTGLPIPARRGRIGFTFGRVNHRILNFSAVTLKELVQCLKD